MTDTTNATNTKDLRFLLVALNHALDLMQVEEDRCASSDIARKLYIAIGRLQEAKTVLLQAIVESRKAEQNPEGAA